MKISVYELSKVEKNREYFDSKNSDNEFECLDFIVNGEPLSDHVYDIALRQPLIQKLELFPDARVLDIGCGTGLTLSHIEDKCSEATGIDISKNLISKYKGKAKVFVCAAHEMPFSDKSFDRIYMLSVSLLFPNFDYFKHVVEKCLSMLDDNGILVISDQPLTTIDVTSGYLTINTHELVDFLNSKKYPYSISAQNRLKRSFSKRSDIVIYKDVLSK
jgi:ubiquinone/menaquinone biosynthesis C-methylase UbiE